MATRPFESRIQDLVYNIEVGIGLQVVKTFLYVLFMLSLAVLYMATEYAGFNSPKAMEYAQLGRAYAESGELNTRHIRPASMWFLIQHKKFEEPLADGKFRPRIENHPDILHAPLYPVILGTAFKTFKTQFPRPDREKFAPEQWVIVPINLVLSFLTALLLYLLGRTLFDPRVALTGCTIFFLSGSVWAHAVSGTEQSLILFLCTFILWCGAKVVQVRENAMAAAWKSVVPALLGTLACVALFLTRYAAVAVVPGFLLVLWIGARRHGWLFALAGLLIFLAGIAPWLYRNHQVSGTVFGLAPYTALQDDNDTFMRSLSPDLDSLDIPKQIQARMISVLPKALGLNGVDFGNGLMIGLFATTFFYRFQRRVPHLLRWGMFLSYLILALTAGVFGEELLGLAHMFWPAIVLFGVAFFYILLDRMQIGVRVVSLSITALFVLLQALPMLFTIMPPRPGNNYPPYNPAHISFVTAPFKDSELITTDMPWATAWYGGRLSMTLPVSLDEFYEVNDYIKRVSCIYLTPLTRDKRYQTDLVRGPFRTWLPISEFRLPRDFPLSFGFPLMSGDQICLADFNRWQPGQ